MIKEGKLIPAGRGRWNLADTVHAYVTYLKAEQANKTKSASEIRVRDARAKEIELRMARTDREVIELAEATVMMDGAAGAFLEVCTALPARITRDPNERRRIEAIIDEEKLRLADRFLKEAHLAEAAGVPDLAEAEEEA